MGYRKSQYDLPGFTAEASIGRRFNNTYESSMNKGGQVSSSLNIIYPAFIIDYGGCTFECTIIGGRKVCGPPIMCTVWFHLWKLSFLTQTVGSSIIVVKNYEKVWAIRSIDNIQLSPHPINANHLKGLFSEAFNLIISLYRYRA